MRRFILPVITVCLLTAIHPVRAAEPDAHAVVRRAVEILGGEERLARSTATQTRMTGGVGDPPGVTFQGNVWSQVGVGMKFKISVELPGIGLTTITEAIHDGKGWKEMNGELSDLSEQELAESKNSAYLDGMPGLVHLLRDKAYTLSLKEDAKIDGKPAATVFVQARAKPDVTLYFDRASGLLVKQTHRQKDANSGLEVLEEVYLSDYRLPNVAGDDEKQLKAAGISVAPDKLVAFLEKLTPDTVNAERIKKLLGQLGDDDFQVREKASEELIKLGSAAVSFLKQALKDTDAEVSRRAEECLKRIGATDTGARKGDVTAAAVRLIGLRKPTGATAALLNVLPLTANDPELREEVYAALAAVGVQNGKSDVILEHALESHNAQRRAAAEAVLGKNGDKWLKKPGRRLFLGDARIPHKAVLFKDGKKVFEREILSQQYFNRFDESIWAKSGSR